MQMSGGDAYNIAAFENQPHLCRRKNDCHFYKETSETELWSWRRGKERIWKSWHSVSESQAALFSFGLFQAVKGTLSSKRMGFVIAAYFCVICITSTGNYSKLTAWQLAVVEAAQIFPYVLGAIATIFYYLCNNNNKLFPSMIYAVSSWGIFQILASTIQLFRRNGQYLSINTTVNLVLKSAIFGLILYQTTTLRTKRKNALVIREIEKV